MDFKRLLSYGFVLIILILLTGCTKKDYLIEKITFNHEWANQNFTLYGKDNAFVVSNDKLLVDGQFNRYEFK